LNVHGVNDVRQVEIHTAEPHVPEPCAFEVELAIEKLKSLKSPGIDQIPAEFITAGCRTIRCEIHKLFLFLFRKKEELHERWKESIAVSMYSEDDKTDCSNDRGISLLQTTYKILLRILLSGLTPYAEKIIGDHQCGFQHNRSATDHVFRIRLILGGKKGIQRSSASALYRMQESL